MSDNHSDTTVRLVAITEQQRGVLDRIRARWASEEADRGR